MKGRKRAMWLAVVIALCLGLVSIADGRGFRRYLRLRREASLLVYRQKQLSDQNQQLRSEIHALQDDPETLEQAAREELGYIRRGEMVLNFE